MSDIQKQYFTTSELAKATGVTKHTLFHYDEIGLLKPEFVNEKGYRYYSFYHCYALDIIHVLKKAGSSLQEIKEFMQNQNAALFVNLIQQKQQELELEQLRLKRMQTFLSGALEMIEVAHNDPRSAPLLETCEAEYFISTRLSGLMDDKEFVVKLTEHRDYCEKHFILHEFPLNTIIYKENFEADRYYPDYVANKLSMPMAGDKVLVKPEGMYAVMDHRGSYETMPHTYAILKDFIRSKGLSISGNIYETELLNYLAEKNPDQFIIRISVGVS